MTLHTLTLTRTIAAIFAVAFTLLLSIADAQAHAVLMGSDPKADAELDGSPKTISLTFNESVGPVFFKVLDSDGNEVGSPSDIKIDKHTISIDLADTLNDGIYLITYRVISADTHPVGGTIVFTLGDVANVDTSAMTSEDTTATTNMWSTPVALNRILQFASLLLAAGLALFGILVKQPDALNRSIPRLGILFTLIAGVTYVAAVGLGGAEMMGMDFASFFTAHIWGMGWNSTLAPSMILGLIGLVVLLAGYLDWSKRKSDTVLWIGIILSLSGLLVTGHAATAFPRWFMTTMVAIHVICVAFWFGALLPLAQSMRVCSQDERSRVLRDFSFWAVISVALILLSGIGISFIQVETLDSLFNTDYGFRLILKLVLVLALLGFAAWNKVSLTPAIDKGAEKAPTRLRRSIAFEVLLIMGIFIHTTALSQYTPPRALIEQSAAKELDIMVESTEDTGAMIKQLIAYAADTTGAPEIVAATPIAMASQGFDETMTKNGYSLQVIVNPAKRGPNNVMAHVMDKNGKMIEVMSVTMEWSLPSAGLEPLQVDVPMSMPGMYMADLSQLVIPGTWSLRTDLLIDDFTKVIFRTEVPIQ